MTTPCQLLHGDCLDLLKAMAPSSVDALITDPPAGIGFMNQNWDKDKGGPEQWRAWLADVMTEARRTMKPGAHGLVWSLPKTSHWTAMALEAAGFEIRDCVYHVFGSGFPKNHNIPLAIDKHLGVEPEIAGMKKQTGPKMKLAQIIIDNGGINDPNRTEYPVTAAASDEAKAWQGWGTALKPAVECWWLVRKPLENSEGKPGTIAENVLHHGTGGINLDDCRVGDEEMGESVWGVSRIGTFEGAVGNITPERTGRWPAHLILTHSEACGLYCADDCPSRGMGDEARFFKTFPFEFELELKQKIYYCPKPSVSEKDAGLDDFAPMQMNDGRDTSIDNAYQRGDTMRKNSHPTVKSQALMTYMITLITPKGGTVLDPFMGSGSTGVAAVSKKFGFVGIEQMPVEKEDPDFIAIARARVAHAAAPKAQKSLFDVEASA